MRRHDTREFAMKLLFQTMIQRDDIDEQIQMFCEENAIHDKIELAYFLDIIHGVREHIEEIDERISRYAIKWTMNRMPKVDVSILRICVFEMFFMSEIPASVSINEAVELAKKYGDEQSKSFVNGVLAKIFLEVDTAEKITPEIIASEEILSEHIISEEISTKGIIVKKITSEDNMPEDITSEEITP